MMNIVVIIDYDLCEVSENVSLLAAGVVGPLDGGLIAKGQKGSREVPIPGRLVKVIDHVPSKVHLV